MNKYARAAGGNWSADATWSTTSGGAADTTAPTAADDVFLDGNSGNVTIDTLTCLARSINCTGYTGTLQHNTTTLLSIGDATAGAGNIALKFVAGMTYTPTGTSSPAIAFVSTSATIQEVDFAGKTSGNVTFNGAGGYWQYTGGHTTPSAATITLTAGTLDINGQTVSWGTFSSSNSNTRSLILGAANITLTGNGNVWFTNTTTGYTLDAGTSTITATGSSVGFYGGLGKTYYDLVLSGTSYNAILSGGTITFHNVTRTGTAVKTDSFQVAGTIVVTNQLTINGNSVSNRMFVYSSVVGTPATINAANVSVSNADFQDITGAGAGDWDLSAITGLSGDCGGNTGITFTAATTQIYTGGTDNWSTAAKWTSHVPLPQDTAVMSGVTGGTITMDMPRISNLDMTGASGSPTLANTSVSTGIVFYGNVIFISAMTFSSNKNISFAGRGNYSITSAGQSMGNGAINFDGYGGTYSLNDAFYTLGNLRVDYGTFTSNNFNITANTMLHDNTNTRIWNLGTSIITLLTTSGNIINTTATTGLTFNGANCTIVIGAVSASARILVGGGLTYGTLRYTLAGSTGKLTITGSNTFKNIEFSDTNNARTLAFTAGTTTIILNKFDVQGLAGQLMVVTSATAAAHTLQKANGVVDCDYLNLSYSQAGGGASWYAGANSTDGGNNTGWLFEDAPALVGSHGAGNNSLKNLQNIARL